MQRPILGPVIYIHDVTSQLNAVKYFLKNVHQRWLTGPKYGSSRPEVFCKKGVLKNFAKFTVKHLCQSLFFDIVYGQRLQLY